MAGAGLALSVPLLALGLERAGFSGRANGLATAIGGIATLFFAPLVPRLAARWGLLRLMLASIAGMVGAMAAFAATTDHPLAWFPLRMAYSCALTGLFVSSEFAINAMAPADRRGVWIGLYSTCLSLGFAAGPLVLHVAGSEGAAPFFAGMVLFALAAAPIAWGGAAFPALGGRKSASTLAFLRRDPGLMSAALVFGAVETGAMGLLPVHALRNGGTAEMGALFVAALAIGNVLFQIPLGVLSDRVGRYGLLIAVAALTSFGAAGLALATGSAAFVPALVAWSGVASGLYMLGLAELGARYARTDLAEANAVFIACYALGMILGPPLAGTALDLSPRHGLFLCLGLFGSVALATLWAGKPPRH